MAAQPTPGETPYRETPRGAWRITFLLFLFMLVNFADKIVVGFIVNRVPTRWVLLVLALIWALAQFPMVGTVGFTMLLICRIILGAGEGPAFAVATHAIYKWFP